MFRAMSAQATPIPSSQAVQNLRRRQLAYIEGLTKTLEKTRTEIAREAGISPSTISKFENDVDNMAQLGTGTMEKLAIYSGVPFETWRANQPLQVFEAEAQFLEDMPRDDFVARAIQAMRLGGNAIDAWELKSNALSLAGYLPGDFLMVDLNGQAQDGDIVCAQSYDRLGRAETIFRRYQKPFLVASSTDAQAFRPLIVDEDRVVIRGVVVSTLRPRYGR